MSNDAIARQAKDLLLGKELFQVTKLPNSRVLKIWKRLDNRRKDRKELMSLAKYLTSTCDRDYVSYKFSVVDAPGENHDFSILEIRHKYNDDLNATISRWNEFKEQTC